MPSPCNCIKFTSFVFRIIIIIIVFLHFISCISSTIYLSHKGVEAVLFIFMCLFRFVCVFVYISFSLQVVVLVNL